MKYFHKIYGQQLTIYIYIYIYISFDELSGYFYEWTSHNICALKVKKKK